jgi:hypothetical protein
MSWKGSLWGHWLLNASFGVPFLSNWKVLVLLSDNHTAHSKQKWTDFKAKLVVYLTKILFVC